jgi:hypothetical protein
MSDKVTCLNCDKIIASIINDVAVPSFEERYNNGCVPVPNAGWFCSQKCALEFEKKYEVTFAKDD